MARDALRFVDMFAGLGGFHLGLSGLGHQCVFACEADAALRRLYEQNFGIAPHHDIRSLRGHRVPRHDILCAGFPCQPFSKAGEQLGLACEKDGDLFEGHLLRIIKYHLSNYGSPRYLLLENVANLARHDNGATYQRMKGKLEELGYCVDQQVLSPHRFGIPQLRERLFIVGSLGGLEHFEWLKSSGKEPSIFNVLDDNPPDARPIPSHYRQCLKVWQDFLDRFPKSEELPSFPIWSMEFGADYPYEDQPPSTLDRRTLARYRGSHGQLLSELPAALRLDGLPSHARGDAPFPDWKKAFIQQNRDFYQRHRRWIDRWMPAILEFPSSLQKLEWNCKGERRNLEDHVLQFRASGVRVKRSSTAPALIAMTSTQVPIIASQQRYMTVRECSRLQGMGKLKHLPETPTRAYRALGNAVNADLIEIIGERLVGRTSPRAPEQMVPAATLV